MSQLRVSCDNYNLRPPVDMLTTFSQTASDVVEDSPPAEEPIVDPQYEQLAWVVGKLLNQHDLLTALQAARRDKRPLKSSRVEKRR